MPPTVYTLSSSQYAKSGMVVNYVDQTGTASTQNISFANKTLSVDSGLRVRKAIWVLKDTRAIWVLKDTKVLKDTRVTWDLKDTRVLKAT